MSEARATPRGSEVLARLMALSPGEQEWVQIQFWGSLDRSEFEDMRRMVEDAASGEEPGGDPSPELARERLLEDPDLTAGEKVLLAALIVSELFEADEFHSRQLTEVLRQSSNPVKNITAAITGLINKGEMEVADPNRAAKNAHKRFRLTAEGVVAARSLSRSGWRGNEERLSKE